MPMTRRINKDLRKLKNKGHKVEMINDKMEEFYVDFHGPPNTLYHGHVWKTKVELLHYPFDPPKIIFVDKIFHPNIDERVVWEGEGCGDPLPRDRFFLRMNAPGRVAFPPDYWTASCDLVYVYEKAIPKLLAEPNVPRQYVDITHPDKPLNRMAAYLFSRDRAKYDETVKSYCTKYAKKAKVGDAAEGSASRVA